MYDVDKLNALFRGLTDFESLPIMDVFDYGCLFYKAQDELVRYFIRHNKDEKMQQKLIDVLTLCNTD